MSIDKNLTSDTHMICPKTGMHCSHDPEDECQDWGCLKNITVKCSTCGDNGLVMDGGNLDDCPACNTGENL